MVDGALGHSVVFEVFGFGYCLDMTQDGFFDVGVVEELLFEFGFVFDLHQGGSGLGRTPVVGFSDDKATDFGPAVLLVQFFGVLDVFHVGDDGLGVEAVFFGGSELLLRKFLAFDFSGLVLSEEGQISGARVVGLGGVVCDF
jgi:hypothetical protein